MKQLFLYIFIIISSYTKVSYSKNNRPILKKVNALSDTFKYDEPAPDNNEQIKVEYFPEIEYPSSILEREPFFFKPNDPNLDAFPDDVKSTFKHMSETKKMKINKAIVENDTLSRKPKADKDVDKYNNSEKSTNETILTAAENLYKNVQEKKQNSTVEVFEDYVIIKSLLRNETTIPEQGLHQDILTDDDEIKTDLGKTNSEKSSNGTNDLSKENSNLMKQDNHVTNPINVTSGISEVNAEIVTGKESSLDDADKMLKFHNASMIVHKTKPLISNETKIFETTFQKNNQILLSEFSDGYKPSLDINELKNGDVKDIFLNNNYGCGKENESVNNDNIKELPSDYFLSEVLMFVTNGSSSVPESTILKVDDREDVDEKNIASQNVNYPIPFTMTLNDTENISIKNDTHFIESFDQVIPENVTNTKIANNNTEQTHVPDILRFTNIDVKIENASSSTAPGIPVTFYTSSEDDLKFEGQILASPLFKYFNQGVTENATNSQKENSGTEQAHISQNSSCTNDGVEKENANSSTAPDMPVTSYTSSEIDLGFEDQIPATPLLEENDFSYDPQDRLHD